MKLRASRAGPRVGARDAVREQREGSVIAEPK